MNRRKIRYIGGLCILLMFGLIFFFATQISRLQNIKEEKDRMMDYLPEFCGDDILGEQQCIHQNSDRVTILVFFGTKCKRCEDEINGFYKNRSNLEDVRIILLSSESIENCTDFFVTHKLFELPNLYILRDTSGHIMRNSGISGVPATFLYDKDKRLVKRFEGEVKTETLLEYIEAIK